MALNKAIVQEKKILCDDVIELKFLAPENFKLIAGQFITIKINDNSTPCFRAYSICSSPRGDFFDVCLKIIAGGRGSNWLNALKAGDEIEYLGPNGKFIFKTPSQKAATFIATGTGVAPFKSMIEDELMKGNKQNLHLIFGVRHETDLIYQDWLKNFSGKFTNFTYQMCLSQARTNDWSGEKGRVTDILAKLDLQPESCEFYICGLKNMIESVEKILHTKGVEDENIHYEKYD